MSFARWWEKANAYASAWQKIFPNDVPSKYNVALGLTVAQHETWCGDAWPGEHNWGAVQLRGLNAQEKAILAGLAPTRANLPAAKAALPPVKGGALHIDTSPVAGAYFVWFAAFPDDEGGAEKFVTTLAKNRPSCFDVLTHQPDPVALASAMYKTHYYEGFHDPHKPGGDDANIQEYGNALATWWPQIYEALAEWKIGAEFPEQAPASPQTFDLGTVKGVQLALNFLAGADQKHIGVTGVLDANTKAAVRTFQQDHLGPFLHPLTVDGNPGADTVYALEEALGVGHEDE